ncbi:MAG TPA: NAD-dependent epimerase/dehydratase family protein [Beijerinckiaceae bacterium]|nr:NAD-dependent epimerase/dehydratase family protein [Beijerinckiaceae bacterium]
MTPPAPATSRTRKPVVLITGAGGFIGTALAERLVEKGILVRSGVRSAPARHGSQVPCDLDRPEQIATAVQGVDLVVHAAYGSAGDMEAQCRSLLDAMAIADVRRLVCLSSIAVYGDATGDIAEDFSQPAERDGYGLAKQACETAVRAFAGQSGRSAVILRPGIVYGAGSPFWIDKLKDRIESGVWGRFGEDGEGIAALIHVDDLAEQIAAAVGRLMDPVGAPTGAVALNAIGPQTPSWNTYFTALARHLGHDLRDLSAGERKLRQAVAVAAKLWRKLGLPGGRAAALFPMPAEMALFARKARYCTNQARDFLGVEPHIGLAEGLARSLPQAKV